MWEIFFLNFIIRAYYGMANYTVKHLTFKNLKKSFYGAAMGGLPTVSHRDPQGFP